MTVSLNWIILQAEAQVQNMLREVQRMQHEVYEQSQAGERVRILPFWIHDIVTIKISGAP